MCFTWNAGDELEWPKHPERAQCLDVERVDVHRRQNDAEHPARHNITT